MKPVVKTRDMDDIISPKHACEFDVDGDKKLGIRVKILMDYIYVWKRESEYGEYERCLVNQIRDPSYHHLALVSANMK